jgi:hypothetical protein
VIKKNEMGGVCGTCGARTGTYRDFVGRPERKCLLGRPKREWEEDNIKMGLKEVGFENVDDEEYFLLRCDRAKSDININILEKPSSSHSSG